MACRHRFRPSGKPDYERCGDCGTYHSLVAPRPETLYTADYWTHERGHSTLDEQVYNVAEYCEGGVSKNECVLSVICEPEGSSEQYALEIGCAPGALLPDIRAKGYKHIFGVEAHRAFAESIHRIGKPDCLVIGLFPDCTAPHQGDMFGLIVACDVFEHSHDPEAFLAECARLLKAGGQLVLMLPMAIADTPERMWQADEHVYLHSFGNFSAMLRDAGFAMNYVDRWCPGHELVSAKKSAGVAVDYDEDGGAGCLPRESE